MLPVKQIPMPNERPGRSISISVGKDKLDGKNKQFFEMEAEAFIDWMGHSIQMMAISL